MLTAVPPMLKPVWTRSWTCFHCLRPSLFTSKGLVIFPVAKRAL
jgi:hypothetical protein